MGCLKNNIRPTGSAFDAGMFVPGEHERPHQTIKFDGHIVPRLGLITAPNARALEPSESLDHAAFGLTTCCMNT